MFDKIEVKENEKLSKYSTIKIGGNARYIAFPKNENEIIKVVDIAKKNNLKFFILGNGSNTLFDDDGFDGVVISFKNCNRMQKNGNFACIDAGVNLFSLNFFLAREELGGLEWSYGIPGTIGGLVYMNGGSFGREISEFVHEITILDKDIKKKILKRDQINFKYRSSGLENCIILSVKLKLYKQKSASVFKKMKNCYDCKKNNQPCDKPSLGSVFKHIEKNGEKFYPAKIIDELGLKGFCIGGIEISSKHSGFFVNNGNATSGDMKKMIDYVSAKINENGFDVEKEIVILEK